MSNLARFFPDVRLTELGKIKIGGKSAQVRTAPGGSTWRAPEKHDYFTVTTLNRTANGDLQEDTALMEQLIAECGDPDGKLRQIPIRLLSNDPDDVMQSAYVWYGGKSVAARSDGETVTWFIDHETGEAMDPPKVQPWTDDMLTLARPNAKYGPQKLFKLHTTFNCIIASPAARMGGVYKFRTTSVITSGQLYGSLVETSRLTCGILMGVPLIMRVTPRQVAPGGKVTTVYVVHVEIPLTDIHALQLQALEQARFMLEHKQQAESMAIAYRKMLPGPGHESPAEAADIAAEFQPEHGNGEPLPPLAPKAPDSFWAGVIGAKPAPVAEAVQPPPPSEIVDPEPTSAPVDAVDATFTETAPALATAADYKPLIAAVQAYIDSRHIAAALAAPDIIKSALADLCPGPKDKRTLADLQTVKDAILAGQYDLETGDRIPPAAELFDEPQMSKEDEANLAGI